MFRLVSFRFVFVSPDRRISSGCIYHMYWSKSAHYSQWPSIPERSRKENLAKILELWESYCLGMLTLFMKDNFNNRDPEAGESVDTYALNFRSLSDTFNFGALKDEIIRDRIVCGVRDSSLRKKLLQVPELTLERCIDICRSAEAASTQLEAMSVKNSHAHPTSEATFVKKPSKGTDESSFVKAWFPYRCICRICRVSRTKKIHRTDITNAQYKRNDK